MKFLLLLLVTAWLVLGGDVAHADPISAITAISTAIAKIGVIGKLLLTVAFNIGASLLTKALTKTSGQAATGVDLSISMGDDVPMSFTVGTYATGGKRKYIGTWGSAGSTPNAFVTDVIEIGNIPCTGLVGFWVGDDKATVLWGEPHADGRGYPVQEYRVGGVDYLWVKFYDGAQTVADAFLLSKFGGDADRPWSSTMIGRGCPYAIITCRYNTNKFSGLPDWAFEPGPPRFYDLRKDSTNGGSGAHRWSDPATWEATSNPIIIAYSIIRGIYYGSEWMFGGQNLAAFRLPSSNWIAAANECDALVDVTGGTEPAYRCGYEITVDKEPLAVIEELGKAANARFAEVGGVFKVLVGAPGSAVYSFTDDDVIVTKGQTFEPFPSLDATYNGIEATYPEPAERWSSKDAPAQYDAALELADGGRRLPISVALNAAPFAVQVQRVMLALIRDYRRFRAHSFYLPPDAYALEPNDVVSWTSARNGYSNKKFVVVQAVPTRTFLVMVSLREIDPSDYDWSSDEQLPVVTGWVGTIAPPVQAMTGWTVVSSNIEGRRPAILAGCSGDLDDVARVWVQVRVKATGAVVFDSDSTPYAAPYSWLISGAWCLPSTTYEVRGKYVPVSSRATEWSSWLDVTTGDYAETDFTATLQTIGSDVRSRFEEVEADLARARATLERVVVDFSLMAAASQVAREAIMAEAGSARVDIVEEKRVRATETEALGQLYTALNASFQANVASVQSMLTVLANADTAMASSITQLNADVASNYAAITNEATTRADADSALTTLVQTAQAKADSASAAVATEQTARANADGALATSVESVAAEFNGRFAEGLVKFEAAAAPSGVDARFAILVRAGTAASYKLSGMYIDLYTVGGVQRSRVAIMTDQFVVTDGSSVNLPLVYEGGVLKLANARVAWAQIDNVVIDWAQIDDAVINNAVFGTTNLDFSSVTSKAALSGSFGGISGISTPNWTTKASVVISNPNPNPVLVDVRGAISASVGGNSSGTWFWRLINTTTNEVVFETSLTLTSSDGSGRSGSITISEFKIAMNDVQGSNTYAFQVRSNSGASSSATMSADARLLWWKR